MKPLWFLRSRSNVDSRPGTALSRVFSELWTLMWPRRRRFALGLALVTTNRLVGLVRPAASKFLLDDVVGAGRAELLWPLVGAVGASVALQAVTSYVQRIVVNPFAHEMVNDLRVQVQAHMGRLPVSYFDANRTGALVSRVMSDVEGIHHLMGRGFMQSFGDILTAVVAVGVLMWLSVPMTLVTLVLMSGFIVVFRRMLRRVRPVFLERQRVQAQVRGRLTESFGGVRIVKGFHAEEREAETFRAGARRITDNLNSGTKVTAVMNMASTFLMGFVTLSVLVLGTYWMMSGYMTVGEFVSFTLVLGIVLAPVSHTVDLGTDLSSAIAAMDRVREVLAVTPEDVDPERTVRVGDIQGHVQFERVTFEYRRGKVVLHDIGLDARPGTVTALVGSSGSGKSTLVGLVAAFHKPLSGTIRVDGIDLSTVRLDSYRQQLGLVLQDNFVFDGTVRENIRFGRPDATDAAVEEAAQTAGVDEFALGMEKGYETIIGERGVKISGGQRQRIGIARAILADPRILILDEATSSLDRECEAYIQEALAALMRGRTTFVIAHRLTTVCHADQILVLEAGRIVERGSHAELMASRGRYHELYTWQDSPMGRQIIRPGADPAVGAMLRSPELRSAGVNA